MNVYNDSSDESSDNDNVNNKALYDEFEQHIRESKEKFKVKEHVITINSKDRNYTIDTPYNFSINFSSLNQNVMNIGKSFKNIKSIMFLGMVIPNIYLDIKEVLSLYNKGFITTNPNPKKFMRVSDLPYLILNISEIRNPNMFGSNTILNKASFVLVLDDIVPKTSNNSGSSSASGSTFTENGNLNNSVVGGTDRNVLYFKDITQSPIIYSASPNSYLNNLEVTISTPEGKVLSTLNNYLECSTIKGERDTTGSIPNLADANPANKKIIIEFKQYLCGDEFNIGDKITFKDVIFTTTNSDLTNFLMRDEGHTILELSKTTGLSPRGTGITKLFNEISIPFEYTIDLETSSNTTGDSIIKNSFDFFTDSSQNSKTFTFSAGKMFNLSLQTLFSLNINNEEQII
jgi:hypothetical protein